MEVVGSLILFESAFVTLYHFILNLTLSRKQNGRNS